MARLTVAMNGMEIGSLTLEKSGAMTFQYRRDWIERPGARAISLSLPLSSSPYKGERVYNFFDNLLPDSEAIRARIQARFRTPTSHPFDLLTSVGRECIGAIQLYPENQTIPNVRTISAEPINDGEIERLLSSYQGAPLGMEKEHDFRISLAGAQEKTALLWHNNRWQRPQGSTPTTHIFKLPIGYLEHNNIDLCQSSENEWLCLQLLAAFGLPTANANLAQFGRQSVLVVERFDRRWSEDKSWLIRLPQEDFCQALGVSPALKYENEGGPGIYESMKLLLGSLQANEDRARFFKAQILFWLLAAIDGHAKNFSLYIEPGSAYRMTPLYDVISAYPLIAQGSLPANRIKMAMSLKGKNRHYNWARIRPRHFLSTAYQVGFSVDQTKSLMNDIIKEAEPSIQAVEDRIPADFPPTISESILDGVRQQVALLAQEL